MVDRNRVEAGNQLLTAMTAEEVAGMTKEPVNKVLEKLMQSQTIEMIYDLDTDQRFYGPYELAREYLNSRGRETVS